MRVMVLWTFCLRALTREQIMLNGSSLAQASSSNYAQPVAMSYQTILQAQWWEARREQEWTGGVKNRDMIGCQGYRVIDLLQVSGWDYKCIQNKSEQYLSKSNQRTDCRSNQLHPINQSIHIINHPNMSKLPLLSVLLLLSCLTLTSCHKRIYYLYQDEAQQDHLTVETLKQNRENHPIHKVDCTKFNCDKFKAPHYPALIFWNGPGTSYKSLYPTNHHGLELYFQAQENHPLKPIRHFIGSITLLEAFGVAIAVATFLYFVFSALFKDRTGLEAAQNKKDL